MLEHLSHFFTAAPKDLPLVEGYYQPSLVVLSISVAIALSWLALLMAESTKNTNKPSYQRLTIITGAVALGSGIWTMHFIGMFAYHLPAPVSFNLGLTILSMLPALAAAWATLAMLTRSHISKMQLLGSGILMGAGIGTMHYGGMLAIETPLQMQHNPIMFAVSILVAVVLAVLAIGVRFGLQNIRLQDSTRFWLGGLIMGSAIAGMHYTAMMAVQFYGEPSTENSGLYVSNFFIALGIASITVTIAVTVAAVNSLIHSRELNREIKVSKQRLEAIFDTAVDAIITIDPKGIVQEFSDSAERIFGYCTTEVRGQNIKMLMPEPYRAEHDSYLARYMSTKVAHIIGMGREVIGQRKDGSTFPMRLAVGKVDLGEDDILFVGLITDISDKKALEESLRLAAKTAEQAAAAKTSFLANMSHEIRTPMNAIIGFTELVLDSQLEPKQRDHLNTIRQSARSLLGLLNDILDTTKLESGKVELDVQNFSLKAIATQIESTLGAGAAKKGLSLSTLYPAAMPEFYQGDSLRILQVLTNLVGNAVKFTEQGGVELVFSYEDGYTHIQVKDTGIGMNGSQLASIFDAFTQADASISRRFGGTGLGTTISRQLVEAMSGRIEVESKLGEGSNFHVWLPLPIGEKCQTLITNEAPQLPSLSILIADDIPQNLELLTLVLEGHGHQVTAAQDGNQAVQLYIDGQFDVVLMDVHMPRVDGLQATRYIREYEQAANKPATPIIALTASVLASDRQLTADAGMNGFAVKPLEPVALFTEIGRLLGYSAQLEQAPSSDAVLAINWARGLSLWGDKQKLIEKIEQYLHTPPNWPSTANEQAFSLHSIKGVAGNLGLMCLSQWAGELEQQARQGSKLMVSELEQAYAELTAAITQALPETAITTSTTVITIDTSQLGIKINQLLEKIDANELDDTLLEEVLTGLTAAQGRKLKDAIDGFDFNQAHDLLSAIVAQLTE